MLARNLNEVTPLDIQKLVSDAVPEGINLDYKLQIDFKKEEFLDDIVALANTHGGDIIYGIRDKKIGNRNIGVPDSAPGIIRLPDGAIDDITRTISDRIIPRLFGIHPRIVEIDSDRCFLVIRVPKSRQFHVTHKDRGIRSFVRSHFASNTPLDYHQFRQRFAEMNSVSQMIHNFRSERLSLLGNGHSPVRMIDSALMVLHILPLSAFSGTPESLLFSELVDVYPHGPSAHLLTSWYNADGLLATDYEKDGQYRSYTQLFRNGSIECVETALGSKHNDVYGFTPLLDGYLINGAWRLTNLLKRLSISPPFYVGFSLVNAKGYKIWSSSYMTDAPRFSIDRYIVMIPEVELEDFEASVNSIAAKLKPACDCLFQAFGHRRSFNWNGDNYTCVLGNDHVTR